MSKNFTETEFIKQITNNDENRLAMGKVLETHKEPNRIFIRGDYKGNQRHWRGNSTKKLEKKFGNYDKERLLTLELSSRT